MEKPVLNLKAISSQKVDPEFNKARTQIDNQLIMFDGNGRTLWYSITHNAYYAGPNQLPLEGEALTKALHLVEWKFTDYNKSTKDQFPPTPENIAKKRAELMAKAPSTPDAFKKVLGECCPTHIVQTKEWADFIDTNLQQSPLEAAKRLFSE